MMILVPREAAVGSRGEETRHRPLGDGERCGAEALLIGVKPVHKRDFFANAGTEAITSRLDMAEERG
jgi:hypothetical protein